MSSSLKSSKESAFSTKEVGDTSATMTKIEPKKGWNRRMCDDNEISIVDTDSISISPGSDVIDMCATPPITEHSNCRILFVSDLSSLCGADDLRCLFSRYGEVVDVRLKYAKITRHPLGYGFVEMASHQAARMCASHLNGEQLYGNPIFVGWASRNRKLFVSSLPKDISLETILSLFEAHGPLIQDGCKLCTSDNGNKYATIEFKHRQDAEKARDRWNGVLFEGSYMIVNWDQAMSARLQKGTDSLDESCSSHSASPEKNKKILYSDFPYFSVHVSFRCKKRGVVVNEKMIYRAYRLFGNMTTVTIKTRFADAEAGTSSGFGFMHFENAEGARCAVNFGHSLDINGVHYEAEFSKHMVRRGEALVSSLPKTLPSSPCSSPQFQPCHVAFHSAYPSAEGDMPCSPTPAGSVPYAMYGGSFHQQQYGMGPGFFNASQMMMPAQHHQQQGCTYYNTSPCQHIFMPSQPQHHGTYAAQSAPGYQYSLQHQYQHQQIPGGHGIGAIYSCTPPSYSSTWKTYPETAAYLCFGGMSGW